MCSLYAWKCNKIREYVPYLFELGYPVLLPNVEGVPNLEMLKYQYLCCHVLGNKRNTTVKQQFMSCKSIVNVSLVNRRHILSRKI